ncbi:MAG: DUF3248 domain-containing protein [Deinococcota bacterium]
MSLGADIDSLLAELDITPEMFEGLASQLVWRIGQRDDDGHIIVRVGFATTTSRFADLPKLKNASDQDLETALKEGDLRVEWVSPS